MKFDFGSFMLGMLAAVIAAMIGLEAAGQEFPSYLPTMQMDVIEMRESTQGHLAELFYSNSASQTSSGANRVYSFDHPTFGLIEVHVHIQINGEGLAEVITVTPLNPQHMAFPPDPVPVEDGQEVVIQIGGGIS